MASASKDPRKAFAALKASGTGGGCAPEGSGSPPSSSTSSGVEVEAPAGCTPLPPTPPPPTGCMSPPPPPADCTPKIAKGAVKPIATTAVVAAAANGPPSSSSSAISGSIFPKGYGFVVFTAVGSIGMLSWKSMKVGIAREEHKIPYPQMYSADNMAFNCAVRAHQNTLEGYPQFLLLLMIGGLEMPYFCALGGWIWIVGRVLYAKGYYSGDPSKRARGTMSIIGMLMLLTATTKFALKHLRN